MSSVRRAAITGSDEGAREDVLAVEEPLEIRLGFEHKGVRVQRNIAITMRTPGNDHELALGFLHGERLVTSAADVERVEHCGADGQTNENVVRVDLVAGVEPDIAGLQRNFYTTSSCGVCGKSSLDALDLSGYEAVVSGLFVTREEVHAMPVALRDAQTVFSTTGGIHAAALFKPGAELLGLREDVGRHNAVDKLVGWALGEEFAMDDCVLFLSGRASFELLQKALAARIPIVCAVGAPSSLAVDLAERFGITLLGFVRDERFNIYCHGSRVTFR